MACTASEKPLLLAFFQAGLRRVDGAQCTFSALKDRSELVSVDVVAIGKAAGAMAQGAVRALGNRIGRGLIITKDRHLPGPGDVPEEFICREAGHPLPDARSLEAGALLLEFLHQQGGGGEWLFLISGGASSLAEVLPDDITLDALRALNRWLQSSGYSISEANRVRKACSLIKGGQLAAHLGGRPARLLMISDVEGNDPATIGSGLLSPAFDEPELSGPGFPD